MCSLTLALGGPRPKLELRTTTHGRTLSVANYVVAAYVSAASLFYPSVPAQPYHNNTSTFDALTALVKKLP